MALPRHGVVRAARGARVGFALKQHQRAWALGRGIREITWTFDPLIRTNAEFNLVRLGAVAVAYLSEFYGEMQDGINAGDRSDRCEVRWELDSLEAVAASDGSRLARPRLDVAGRRGAVLLAVDADGGPEWPAEDDGWPDPGLRLCQVPADIVAMRTEDPERALAWRYALRHTVGAALADGFVARTFLPEGWYVLTPGRDEEATR